MPEEQKKEHNKAKTMYARFAGMILTSMVLMYLFTYLNTFAWDHVAFSEQRVYMTLTMTAMMATVMLSFMRHMLTNRRVNLAIYAGSVVLFVVALWLVRSQVTVQDVSYMKAMIPHHSIAILTSKRAQISDPRVRELADEIIDSQLREISMMKVLIENIESHGTQAPGDRETKRATRMATTPRATDPAGRSLQDHGGSSEKGDKAGEEAPGGANLKVEDESFTAGPRRLLDVRFSPDGEALYIADFGALAVKGGAMPVPKTGVIWRVVPQNVRPTRPPTKLSPPR